MTIARLFVPLFVLSLGVLAPICEAASIYTRRPKADFDEFLKALDGHGKWVKHETLEWLFVPNRQTPPMSNGRWVYTDYGWYFIGDEPYSFATDHYGVWLMEKGTTTWRWHPGSTWHPHTVEFRETKTHIGWRPTVLNTDGSILEPEGSRFARPESWIWIPREKFGQHITPADLVTGDKAVDLLDNSKALGHIYHAWQPLERTGPSPYPVYNVEPPNAKKQEETASANEDAFLAASGLAPVEAEIDGTDENYQPDTKVPKLILMNLQEWNDKPPAEAKPGELYSFRPNLYQEDNGLFRRIDRWTNPDAIKRRAEDIVAQTLAAHGGPRVFDGSEDIGGLGTYDPAKAPQSMPASPPNKPTEPAASAPAAVPVAKAVPVAPAVPAPTSGPAAPQPAPAQPEEADQPTDSPGRMTSPRDLRYQR